MPVGIPQNLHLGTSSWSSKDWVGVVYPPGTASRDFITVYAEQFACVEIDATFYRCPSRSTVRGWAERTPDHFRFAAKVPQTVTHEAELVDCQEPFGEFVDVMAELGPKRGPLLLQFPYYATAKRPPLDDFVGRLNAFLSASPPVGQLAVEVRNKTWLRPPLLDCLRRHNAALVLLDHPWMPDPAAYGPVEDVATADFGYVRWLGDRKGIERRTRSWNATVVDRTTELDAWVPVIRALLATKTVAEVWGFFNNHYGGHAPDSIRLFADRWLAARGPR